MKCHSTNTNRSSNYNNISNNNDKGYCKHNHFISSMFYYLRNHNHNNDYHNHCNHNHYSNHKPLHGISRLLTSPTDTMTLLMSVSTAFCLSLTLNFIINNILVPHNTYATESSISLSIGNNNKVSVDISSTSANGAFKKSSPTTISASTNNATGYTLSISAPTNAGSDYDKLINNNDNNAKLTSIQSSITEEQFKALNATAYNNMWGYLPSKYCTGNTSDTCSTNTSFLKAPTTTGDTLDITNSANSTANDYNLSIGARIDSSTKSGKYQNTFVVKLIGNAIPYSIVYDDNVVSNMPTDVSSTTPNSTVTIENKTPVRAGYKFLGWCLGTEDTSNITTLNGTDTCSSTIYQPNSTLSIDQTGTGNNFRLYAMWKEIITFNKAYAAAGKTQSGGYYIMQDANASICSAVDEDQVGEVKDSRDGTIYHIGKLKDGNCWLLDNLALDLTNDTILNSLSADNTNIDTTNDPGALEALKGTTLGTTSDKYATAKVANWTSGYSSSAPLVNLTNKDRTAPNGTSSDPMQSQATSGGWKYGGYYNYCAASAGSYCYGNGPSSGNATSDICPKGWRMSTGNTSGEYSALANAIYGSTGSTSDSTAYANYRNALRLPLSGYFLNGSARDQGSYGGFWSSTRLDSNYMHILSLHTSLVNPANDSGRSSGRSVRCVLGS